MDKIIIEDLEVFARHGVFPEENRLGQKFLVSAVLYTDTEKAGKSDDLKESIDYGRVCHFITEYMQEHTCKLLEAAAEQLARALLLEELLLKSLKLTIHKPWAPVGLPLKTVGVEIERGWHTAYIALGANMGDERAYLDGAVKALNEAKGCRVVKVSDYLVTKPYGGVEQNDFLNGALELKTLLSPLELLELLHSIEQSAGRERKIHWGPRTLDLDILLYDDLILETPELTIPHREMHLRSFVLDPLVQIAPRQRHPVFGKTVEELKSKL